ncbi:hypothetical protein HRR86_007558 [Exophiala dermatitidis]|nr:hypothetical protein HRR74_007600 [Exophiala dermatitidis]KAJ4510260.1 hypothetical protein HRR73_007058 [Exophiala dermatitidis]KAJ4539273.1 hypothetical protein HRR77_006680 [Exophiala dermatitidis]KAJ4564722.1 hypothetical protein HRR79_005971 [Exophiala dermatitidis]KAJ4573171.1 hypothetical protein HRR82_006822 [Exophiala dermatitidis]
MAILNNVEITVASDGQPVREYQPPADDREALNACKLFPNSPTVVKYIEATPGGQFQIRYLLTGHQSFEGADYLSLDTAIDGQDIRSPAVLKESYISRKGDSWSRYEDVVEGAETGSRSKTTLSPFYWRELSRTGPESDWPMAYMKKKYENVETITVEVTRMRRVQKSATRLALPIFEQEIPEKVLKGQAVDTGAHLGKSKRPSHRTTLLRGEAVGKPCAVFIFLYRSKSSYPKSEGLLHARNTLIYSSTRAEALQALGVIPRSPSPIPLEERDPDTLTREEAVELLRRQRAEAEAAEMVQIKKEESEDDTRQFSTMKRSATDESDDEMVMIAPPERKKARKEQTVIELSD